jgi:hypothetical protein
MSSKIIAGTTSGTALNMSADTSGILEIQTGATPTTAITVDASQNVGIGTTSQIGGSRINFYQPNSLTDLKIAAAVTTGTNATYQVFINNTVTTIGTENSSGGSLVSGSSAYSTVISNNGAYPLSFGTNNNERMRIDSSGKVGIGTNSPSYTLDVSGAAQIRGQLNVPNYSTSVPSLTNNALYFIGNAINNQAYAGQYYSGGTAHDVYCGMLPNSVSGSSDSWGLGIVSGGTYSNKFFMNSAGNITVVGSLSKGSGSFRIDHPLPQLEQTHQLVHSFIEGPQADLIYRGRVTLVNGKANVNIDETSSMTAGTFEALCRDVQCFTTNESDWIPVRGSVTGNILTIESQDPNSNSDISWMVIGERKDKHMLDTDWTDETGKVIVELKKEVVDLPTRELVKNSVV